jgi:hypothetical protein
MKHCTQFGVYDQYEVLYLHAKQRNIQPYVHITRHKYNFVRLKAFYENRDYLFNGFSVTKNERRENTYSDFKSYKKI